MCGSTFVLLSTRKLVLEMLAFKMNPCIKSSFSQKVNLNLILELPCVLYSIISPSVGVVGLVEYVCTHSILIFLQKMIQTSFPKTLSRGSVLHPTLPVDRVTRRELRMAQDSDDLFVVNVVV